MKSETKFFRCEKCGNVVGLINNSKVPLYCCNEKMTQLEANTADAAKEKHLPVAQIEDNKVTVLVSDVEHPMTEDHYIQWVYLNTKKGGQRKALSPSDSPTVTFLVIDDEPQSVYSYCNKHGLWRTDV